jgi:hypothetical protein
VKAFLIVATDPTSESFAALTEALQPLQDRTDVMLLLFPQGGHQDVAVLESCKKAGWTGPFAYSRFTTAFTASMIGEKIELPSVMLQSPEGRALFSATWSDATPAALEQAIVGELGPMTTRVVERKSSSNGG